MACRPVRAGVEGDHGPLPLIGLILSFAFFALSLAFLVVPVVRPDLNELVLRLPGGLVVVTAYGRHEGRLDLVVHVVVYVVDVLLQLLGLLLVLVLVVPSTPA